MLVCIILFIFILLFVITLYYLRQEYLSTLSNTEYQQSKQTFEHFLPFTEKDTPFENYLYPTQDSYCYKLGLQTPNSPKLCSDSSQTLYTSNCRCVDNKNQCKICWNPLQLNSTFS
jgi:hypothetical protein